MTAYAAALEPSLEVRTRGTEVLSAPALVEMVSSSGTLDSTKPYDEDNNERFDPSPIARLYFQSPFAWSAPVVTEATVTYVPTTGADGGRVLTVNKLMAPVLIDTHASGKFDLTNAGGQITSGDGLCVALIPLSAFGDLLSSASLTSGVVYYSFTLYLLHSTADSAKLPALPPASSPVDRPTRTPLLRTPARVLHLPSAAGARKAGPIVVIESVATSATLLAHAPLVSLPALALAPPHAFLRAKGIGLLATVDSVWQLLALVLGLQREVTATVLSPASAAAIATAAIAAAPVPSGSVTGALFSVLLDQAAYLSREAASQLSHLTTALRVNIVETLEFKAAVSTLRIVLFTLSLAAPVVASLSRPSPSDQELAQSQPVRLNAHTGLTGHSLAAAVGALVQALLPPFNAHPHRTNAVSSPNGASLPVCLTPLELAKCLPPNTLEARRALRSVITLAFLPIAATVAQPSGAPPFFPLMLLANALTPALSARDVPTVRALATAALARLPASPALPLASAPAKAAAALARNRYWAEVADVVAADTAVELALWSRERARARARARRARKNAILTAAGRARSQTWTEDFSAASLFYCKCEASDAPATADETVEAETSQTVDDFVAKRNQFALADPATLRMVRTEKAGLFLVSIAANQVFASDSQDTTVNAVATAVTLILGATNAVAWDDGVESACARSSIGSEDTLLTANITDPPSQLTGGLSLSVLADAHYQCCPWFSELVSSHNKHCESVKNAIHAAHIAPRTSSDTFNALAQSHVGCFANNDAASGALVACSKTCLWLKLWAAQDSALSYAPNARPDGSANVAESDTRLLSRRALLHRFVISFIDQSKTGSVASDTIATAVQTYLSAIAAQPGFATVKDMVSVASTATIEFRSATDTVQTKAILGTTAILFAALAAGLALSSTTCSADDTSLISNILLTVGDITASAYVSTDAARILASGDSFAGASGEIGISVPQSLVSMLQRGIARVSTAVDSVFASKVDGGADSPTTAKHVVHDIAMILPLTTRAICTRASSRMVSSLALLTHPSELTAAVMSYSAESAMIAADLAKTSAFASCAAELFDKPLAALLSPLAATLREGADASTLKALAWLSDTSLISAHAESANKNAADDTVLHALSPGSLALTLFKTATHAISSSVTLGGFNGDFTVAVKECLPLSTPLLCSAYALLTGSDAGAPLSAAAFYDPVISSQLFKTATATVGAHSSSRISLHDTAAAGLMHWSDALACITPIITVNTRSLHFSSFAISVATSCEMYDSIVALSTLLAPHDGEVLNLDDDLSALMSFFPLPIPPRRVLASKTGAVRAESLTDEQCVAARKFFKNHSDALMLAPAGRCATVSCEMSRTLRQTLSAQKSVDDALDHDDSDIERVCDVTVGTEMLTMVIWPLALQRLNCLAQSTLLPNIAHSQCDKSGQMCESQPLLWSTAIDVFAPTVAEATAEFTASQQVNRSWESFVCSRLRTECAELSSFIMSPVQVADVTESATSIASAFELADIVVALADAACSHTNDVSPLSLLLSLANGDTTGAKTGVSELCQIIRAVLPHVPFRALKHCSLSHSPDPAPGKVYDAESTVGMIKTYLSSADASVRGAVPLPVCRALLALFTDRVCRLSYWQRRWLHLLSTPNSSLASLVTLAVPLTTSAGDSEESSLAFSEAVFASVLWITPQLRNVASALLTTASHSNYTENDVLLAFSAFQRTARIFSRIRSKLIAFAAALCASTAELDTHVTNASYLLLQALPRVVFTAHTVADAVVLNKASTQLSSATSLLTSSVGRFSENVRHMETSLTLSVPHPALATLVDCSRFVSILTSAYATVTFTPATHLSPAKSPVDRVTHQAKLLFHAPGLAPAGIDIAVLKALFARLQAYTLSFPATTAAILLGANDTGRAADESKRIVPSLSALLQYGRKGLRADPLPSAPAMQLTFEQALTLGATFIADADQLNTTLTRLIARGAAPTWALSLFQSHSMSAVELLRASPLSCVTGSLSSAKADAGATTVRFAADVLSLPPVLHSVSAASALWSIAWRHWRHEPTRGWALTVSPTEAATVALAVLKAVQAIKSGSTPDIKSVTDATWRLLWSHLSSVSASLTGLVAADQSIAKQSAQPIALSQRFEAAAARVLLDVAGLTVMLKSAATRQIGDTSTLIDAFWEELMRTSFPSVPALALVDPTTTTTEDVGNDGAQWRRARRQWESVQRDAGGALSLDAPDDLRVAAPTVVPVPAPASTAVTAPTVTFTTIDCSAAADDEAPCSQALVALRWSVAKLGRLPLPLELLDLSAFSSRDGIALDCSNDDIDHATAAFAALFTPTPRVSAHIVVKLPHILTDASHAQSSMPYLTIFLQALISRARASSSPLMIALVAPSAAATAAANLHVNAAIDGVAGARLRSLLPSALPLLDDPTAFLDRFTPCPVLTASSQQGNVGADSSSPAAMSSESSTTQSRTRVVGSVRTRVRRVAVKSKALPLKSTAAALVPPAAAESVENVPENTSAIEPVVDAPVTENQAWGLALGLDKSMLLHTSSTTLTTTLPTHSPVAVPTASAIKPAITPRPRPRGRAKVRAVATAASTPAAAMEESEEEEDGSAGALARVVPKTLIQQIGPSTTAAPTATASAHATAFCPLSPSVPARLLAPADAESDGFTLSGSGPTDKSAKADTAADVDGDSESDSDDDNAVDLRPRLGLLTVAHSPQAMIASGTCARSWLRMTHPTMSLSTALSTGAIQTCSLSGAVNGTTTAMLNSCTAVASNEYGAADPEVVLRGGRLFVAFVDGSYVDSMLLATLLRSPLSPLTLPTCPLQPNDTLLIVRTGPTTADENMLFTRLSLAGFAVLTAQGVSTGSHNLEASLNARAFASDTASILALALSAHLPADPPYSSQALNHVATSAAAVAEWLASGCSSISLPMITLFLWLHPAVTSSVLGQMQYVSGARTPGKTLRTLPTIPTLEALTESQESEAPVSSPTTLRRGSVRSQSTMPPKHIVVAAAASLAAALLSPVQNAS